MLTSALPDRAAALPQQNARYLPQYASQELRKKLLIYPITPVSTVGAGMSL